MYWIVGFVIVAIYSYWPTLQWIEESWRNEPDYSHGYLVLPLAGVLCWIRSDSVPFASRDPKWFGISLILVAVLMRFVSRLTYTDFLDGWSLVPLLLGAIWVLWGWKAMRWTLPAAAFLLLMIPMPFQAESMLSWHLQGTATELTTALLRVLGQPAVSEGHVIWINDQQLLVEQACSGLRIFMGVAALAYFWAATVTRERGWTDRLVLIALVVPLAVLVNSVRITIVGILYQRFTDPGTQNTIHDWSGYLMIPFAFGLLWLCKVFWEHLYHPVTPMLAKDLMPDPRHDGLATGAS